MASVSRPRNSASLTGLGLVAAEWSRVAFRAMSGRQASGTPICRRLVGRPSARGEIGEVLRQGRVLGQAQNAAQHPVFLLRMRCVEPQHRRQQDRVERAMVERWLLEPAERVRQRVDGAQALLEGEAALERGHHHFLTGPAVCAVRHRPLDPACRSRQAVQGDRLGGRIEARREVGLDAMGDRIHAGGGGEPGRQAEGQLRVADGGLGDQMRADEAELAAVGQRDQRGAADLAAGAGGGRDRDHRRGGGRDLGDAAQDRGIVRQWSRVGGEQSRALGEVDGRAAAQGNEAVALFGAVEGERGQDRLLGRVGGGGVEDRGRVRGRPARTRSSRPAGADPGVGHQEGPPHAEAGQCRVELGQHAEAEADVREIEDVGQATGLPERWSRAADFSARRAGTARPDCRRGPRAGPAPPGPVTISLRKLSPSAAGGRTRRGCRERQAGSGSSRPAQAGGHPAWRARRALRPLSRSRSPSRRTSATPGHVGEELEA